MTERVLCGFCHEPILTTGSGYPAYGPVHVRCWHKAVKDPVSRLRVLLIRIDAWEDMDDAVGQFEGAETLILDIKQCLESICETASLTPIPR